MDNNVSANLSSMVKNKEEDDITQPGITAQKELIELDGRKGFFDLRTKWSEWIIRWINFLLLFHVGINTTLLYIIFSNPDYIWLIPVMVFENFVQILGMGYIVIKCLYPPYSK